jgi:hypothetical protein
MNKYIVQLSVEIEVEAFNSDDALEYVQDIFSIDDEIKKVSINKISPK